MIVVRRESRSVLPKTLRAVVDDAADVGGPGRGAGEGSLPCQAACPAFVPYSARNVSSSDGSRLTKSSSS